MTHVPVLRKAIASLLPYSSPSTPIAEPTTVARRLVAPLGLDTFSTREAFSFSWGFLALVGAWREGALLEVGIGRGCLRVRRGLEG